MPRKQSLPQSVVRLHPLVTVSFNLSFRYATAESSQEPTAVSSLLERESVCLLQIRELHWPVLIMKLTNTHMKKAATNCK